MTLWTIQHIEVLDEINKFGYYVCNPDKLDFISDEMISIKNAYNWLVVEMEKRIGKKPNNVIYPIWAWHTRDWKYKKPDLRQCGYGTPGKQYACIELEIPDKQVVLSDFDIWHYVLNDWYFDNSFNKIEWDNKHAYYNSLSFEKKLKERVKSWQEVFNITPYKSDWFCRGRYIQATFWVLQSNQIKKIQYFKAK